MLADVDAVINAQLQRPKPSLEAAVIAWAGGLIHASQIEKVLTILGTIQDPDDPDIRRWGSLERLTEPASPRIAEQAAALAVADRQAMADAVLGVALAITADPARGLLGQVAALRAVNSVRADLTDLAQLSRTQCRLVAGLEAIGDPASALQVAPLKLLKNSQLRADGSSYERSSPLRCSGLATPLTAPLPSPSFRNSLPRQWRAGRSPASRPALGQPSHSSALVATARPHWPLPASS